MPNIGIQIPPKPENVGQGPRPVVKRIRVLLPILLLLGCASFVAQMMLKTNHAVPEYAANKKKDYESPAVPQYAANEKNDVESPAMSEHAVNKKNDNESTSVPEYAANEKNEVESPAIPEYAANEKNDDESSVISYETDNVLLKSAAVSDIEVTGGSITEIDGEYYYSFAIQNKGNVPFDGVVRINLGENGDGSVTEFKIDQPIEPSNTYEVKVAVKTATKSIDTMKKVGFTWEAIQDNQAVLNGKGNISSTMKYQKKMQ